ncbi:ABC transporter substrate-binding protein [Pseudorhizobium flavum]|uniref:ABC transporter substrate-binding protein n=1 Tax=Pseudorhizobium flavum TaxID=1335061 RepID=UPI00376F8EF4
MLKRRKNPCGGWLWFLAIIFSLSPIELRAANLSIITSYPPSFYEPFQKAFEKSNADVSVTIIQRNTGSATRFILGKPEPAADLFWASATDAFELLKQKGALSTVQPRETNAPARILGYPVNDPDGFYLGFALSSYGLVYNPAYLAQYDLPVPQSWQDLLKPVYAGHIGITSPSRSGTTHLIVEALLQTYGWDRGWALLSELGGNLSTVTARSFGVASGVAQRRFGIGVTIDFLATAPDVSGAENVFVLTPDPIYVPASIAILSQAKNRNVAERFIDFLFSREGQSILLLPNIARIPVLPELNAHLLPRPDSGGLLAAHGLDAPLSARRYGIVNLLFDDYIVRRRASLARLWSRLRELERVLLDDPAQFKVLAEARRLLGKPPISEEALQDLADELAGEWPRSIARTPQQQALAREIRAEIEQNLTRAEGLLRSVSTASEQR